LEPRLDIWAQSVHTGRWQFHSWSNNKKHLRFELKKMGLGNSIY